MDRGRCQGLPERVPSVTHPALSKDELGIQGFGAMRLRDDPVTEPDRDPAGIINAALDAGIRMIDTADAYGNEELIGRIVRPRRAEVILASKFGLQWRGQVAGEFQVRADPAYVRLACEASLRRLATDVIDLYYLHHRSDATPIEDTIGAMAGLVTAGRVRAIGLSNVSAEDLRRANAVHPIAALQEKWSLIDRGIEATLLATAVDLGVAIVAHSPASHGRLHPGSGAFYREPTTAGGVVERIAKRLRAIAGQVALAWVHHREPVHGHRVIPLPGTTRLTHARDNFAAAVLQLSVEDLRLLDEAHSVGFV